jgi:hypothetical protein
VLRDVVKLSRAVVIARLSGSAAFRKASPTCVRAEPMAALANIQGAGALILPGVRIGPRPLRRSLCPDRGHRVHAAGPPRRKPTCQQGRPKSRSSLGTGERQQEALECWPRRTCRRRGPRRLRCGRDSPGNRIGGPSPGSEGRATRVHADQPTGTLHWQALIERVDTRSPLAFACTSVSKGGEHSPGLPLDKRRGPHEPPQ